MLTISQSDSPQRRMCKCCVTDLCNDCLVRYWNRISFQRIQSGTEADLLVVVDLRAVIYPTLILDNDVQRLASECQGVEGFCRIAVQDANRDLDRWINEINKWKCTVERKTPIPDGRWCKGMRPESCLGELEKFIHQKKHCSDIPMDSQLLLRASCLPYADGEQPSIPVINTRKKMNIKMMIYKI